ncbi:MAG: hypoxanthine phosphoribosyltransferase [Deltaproteobacteria bacterium]|nr:hypoxanthine phosphoribosyltransferase [Deltaproteobacteria bacterium]
MTPWAKDVAGKTQQPLLAVCLLRGAMIFFSDLVREIDCPVEFEVCRLSFYCDKTDSKINNTIPSDYVPFDVSGRAILLVDDFCDTGDTLKALHDSLLSRQAADIRSVTLLLRNSQYAVYKPYWSALEVARKEWVVGYGLDNKNKNRNLKDIYYIEGTGQ